MTTDLLNTIGNIGENLGNPKVFGDDTRPEPQVGFDQYLKDESEKYADLKKADNEAADKAAHNKADKNLEADSPRPAAYDDADDPVVSTAASEENSAAGNITSNNTDSPKEIFAALHAAARGEMDASQYSLMARVVNSELTAEEADKIGKVLDKVESGEISPSEAKKILSKLGLYKSFEKLVSFLEAFRSQFQTADIKTNKDLIGLAKKTLAQLNNDQTTHATNTAATPATAEAQQPVLKSLTELKNERVAKQQPASLTVQPTPEESSAAQVLVKHTPIQPKALTQKTDAAALALDTTNVQMTKLNTQTTKPSTAVDADTILDAEAESMAGLKKLDKVLAANDIKAHIRTGNHSATGLQNLNKPSTGATILAAQGLQTPVQQQAQAALVQTPTPETTMPFQTALETVDPVMMNASAMAKVDTVAAAKADIASFKPAMANAATEQVAVHIQKAVKGDQNKIRIHLKPMELGAVDVDLSVNKDGGVKAVVKVERPETLALLTKDAIGMQKALQEAGLEARQANIEYSLAGDSSSQDHAGKNSQQQNDFGTTPAMSKEAEQDETLAAVQTIISEAELNRDLANGKLDIQI